MVAVLKTAFASFGERGFESHPLRGPVEGRFDLYGNADLHRWRGQVAGHTIGLSVLPG